MSDPSAPLFSLTLLAADRVAATTSLVSALPIDESGRPPVEVDHFPHGHGELEGPWDLVRFDPEQRTALYAARPQDDVDTTG